MLALLSGKIISAPKPPAFHVKNKVQIIIKIMDTSSIIRQADTQRLRNGIELKKHHLAHAILFNSIRTNDFSL